MVTLKNKKILLALIAVIFLGSGVISYYFFVLKPNKNFEAEASLIISDYNEEIDVLNKRFQKDLLFRGEDAENAKGKVNDLRKRASNLPKPKDKRLTNISKLLCNTINSFYRYINASIDLDDGYFKYIKALDKEPDIVGNKLCNLMEVKKEARSEFVTNHGLLKKEILSKFGIELYAINFDRDLSADEWDLLNATSTLEDSKYVVQKLILDTIYLVEKDDGR